MLALLLLLAAAVEQVHGLPLLGERSCPDLQLTRPTTAATQLWRNSGLSMSNLTGLLVKGPDPISLDQALTAHSTVEGLEDRVCKATSYPVGDKVWEAQKGCGTPATFTAGRGGSESSFCIHNAHGLVSA